MQVFIGQAIYYVKPALEVSPYFHILALFKSFRKKGAAYTSHTRIVNN
jgi:hypothetical protein